MSCAFQAFSTLVKLLEVYLTEMWFYKWSTLFQKRLDQSRGVWDLHLSWLDFIYPLKESKTAPAPLGATPITDWDGAYSAANTP